MAVVLITGSADRIGLYMAQHCAAKGYDVAIHYHSAAEKAHGAVTALQHLYPNQRFHAFKADLSNAEAAPYLMQSVHGHFGRVDVLINNAAIFAHDTLASCEAENFDAHMNINARAPLLLSKAFSQLLDDAAALKPHIINIIDQRVLNLTSHFLSYSLSKAALWAMTQMLALELAPRIRVNGLAPGHTLPAVFQAPEQFKSNFKGIPLQYPTPLSDFSAALDFLFASESVTGQLIALDGGQHLGWSFPK